MAYTDWPTRKKKEKKNKKTKHGREADKEAPKLHTVGRTGKLLRDFGFVPL